MESISRNRTMSCLQDNDRRVLIQHADTFLEYSLVFEEVIPTENTNDHNKSDSVKVDRIIPFKDVYSGR